MGWNSLFVFLWICSLVSLAFTGIAEERHKRRLFRLYSGTSGIKPPPDQWFTQRLDHSDPTNPGTWKQRYQASDTWFKNSTNNPVFLMIGGEGYANGESLVNRAAWTIYARKFNAMCFQLEHRFYGESHPKKDLSVESLRYLSSEQALGDIAYFILGMKEKYGLSANKWVSFGGSYAGSLAAWARLKYPHLIHAAVSSSGPLLAKADFEAYNEVVNRSLAECSPQCAKNVHDAALAVEDMIKMPKGPSILSKKFNSCSDLDTSKKQEVAFFVDELAGTIHEIVQYNSGLQLTLLPTVYDICRLMNDDGIPLIDRYAKVIERSAQSCIENYGTYIEEMRNTSYIMGSVGARAWTYQTCTEFGFYQTSSTRKEMSGSLVNLQFFIDQCKDIFGIDFDQFRLNEGIKRTNVNYGALDIAVSRVVFVQGSDDPWSALGISKSTDPLTPAILIDGASHCADMHQTQPGDTPQLTAARAKIEQILGKWLTPY